MQSQSRLILTLTLLTCSFLFAQTSTSQEPLSPLALAGDENGTDDGDGDAHKSHPASPKARIRSRVTADGTRLPDGNQTAALALVTPFETEQLIIEGTEVNPVEYPALPEV